ncbi:unnamed protein product [Ostreobium quekettii]|uniref:BZIP domain-containing protein n=1 Tax=Ostreobium quekettii TaxID=121088 RepID=A0A8S1IRU7_9CHLO|nr:unnamed protein product [Ostreobium quekettii]|eukprot:evm.model.scf_399.5 EVM.evm.TU.scf_399.5   scf_399:36321-38020(-)
MEAKGARAWEGGPGNLSMPVTLLLPPNVCGVAPADVGRALTPQQVVVQPPPPPAAGDAPGADAPVFVLLPEDVGRVEYRMVAPGAQPVVRQPPVRGVHDGSLLSSLLSQYLPDGMPRREDQALGVRPGGGRLAVRPPACTATDTVPAGPQGSGGSGKDSADTDPSFASADGMSGLENNAAEDVAPASGALRKARGRREGGPFQDVPISKDEKRRERNRRAQRNFRERQRNRILGLEEELTRLKDRVRRLEVEYAELNRENQLVKQCVGFVGDPPAVPRGTYRRPPSPDGGVASIEDQLFGKHVGGALLQTVKALSR